MITQELLSAAKLRLRKTQSNILDGDIEQLAEVACRAEADFLGDLLDAFFGADKKLLCGLDSALGDVFHRPCA